MIYDKWMTEMKIDHENWDVLLLGAHVATMVGEAAYGAIFDGAVAMRAGAIAWVGERADVPQEAFANSTQVVELDGGWLTPGLIDCHTHLVYGGQRSLEFAMRLHGRSYEDIALAGGGIISTVEATRKASESELLESARWRLRERIKQGCTVVEIKSGYGLDVESELKMLRIARLLGEIEPVTVKTTFLGAHALPPEFVGDRAGYIDLICNEMMPAVAEAGLADAVDGFCETVGFSRDEIARVFDAAKAHGLPVKLHAEQLSNQGGCALAAQYGALSCDHVEHVCEEGVMAMAQAGVAAVLLPAAYYFLQDTQRPPVEWFRKAGVPMAVATDGNPGTAPTSNLLLTLNMACTLFGLTPEEALRGVTEHAATALGMGHSHGTLEAGKAADLVHWNMQDPAELAYHVGENLRERHWVAGDEVTLV